MPSPKLPEGLRFAVLARDGGVCVYCAASAQNGAKMTVDHLMPRSWGGGDEPTNLVAACFHCNVAVKGGMDLKAFGGMLKRQGLIASKKAFVAHIRAIAARPLPLVLLP